MVATATGPFTEEQRNLHSVEPSRKTNTSKTVLACTRSQHLGVYLNRDPSTFSEGDWRHCYVGLEGPGTF